MKTVYLDRDFDFPLHPRRFVRFYAGTTYSRVLELAAREIERQGAGRIVDLDKPGDAVITTAGPLTPKQAADLRRKWQANYRRAGAPPPVVDASHAFKPRNKRKPRP